MHEEEIEIGPLDVSEAQNLNDAAAVAARAFQFDPFFAYLSWRPLLRARGLGIYGKSTMASIGGHGEILGARRIRDGRLLGVAAWVKPGGYPLPVSGQLIQAVGAVWALWPRPKGLVDGAKYLLAIDKDHPKELHWYLAMLVADPSVQRSGIGTRLLIGVLERADAEGVPSYLETQNEENVPYYRRFGFEVVHELHPVPSGPALWALRREPKR